MISNLWGKENEIEGREENWGVTARGNWEWFLEAQNPKAESASRRGGGEFTEGLQRPLVEEYEERTGCG